MLPDSCERCSHYDAGRCKLYRFYPQSPISTASACDQFTTVNNTKQSCVNCVHYRDKRCFLHEFDVTDPEYSATICAEFTPINTQKNEMNKFEKNLEMIAENKYTCKDCVHFQERKDQEDDLCKLHNQRVSSSYYCNDFLQYVTPKSELTQKDAINPSYYRNGKVSCIDAMESATVNKKGDEAVSVGLIIKYLWRYEEKGGIEDVKKSQWYINRLIKVLEDKDETD